MDVLATLEARGFVQQTNGLEALRERLAAGPTTFYVGFDPTADSLHVGHLMPVMAMAWLQRAGHRPIAVVGGGTARVGDPTGKTEMRRMLSDEEISRNTDVFRGQLSGFLDLGEGQLVDNADWLLDLKYIAFLRDIGSLFSVNRMLAAEAYKQRLERGLSFIEFNYQILQAYDFLELYRRHGCELQLGGDDQWGNILAGSDLIRRCHSRHAFCFTTPLLTTSTGAKMGKTVGGAVWLSADRLAPFDYYQYWVNVDDLDVGKLLKVYTFLSLDRIAELEALKGADVRKAKAVLAWEATKLAHGEQAANQAQAAAKAMVAGASTDDLPTHALDADTGLLVALADAGMCKSRGEARRLVQGGGVKVDGTKLSDIGHVLEVSDLGADGIVVRIGKKRAVRFIRT